MALTKVESHYHKVSNPILTKLLLDKGIPKNWIVLYIDAFNLVPTNVDKYFPEDPFLPFKITPLDFQFCVLGKEPTDKSRFPFTGSPAHTHILRNIVSKEELDSSIYKLASKGVLFLNASLTGYYEEDHSELWCPFISKFIEACSNPIYPLHSKLAEKLNLECTVQSTLQLMQQILHSQNN